MGSAPKCITGETHTILLDNDGETITTWGDHKGTWHGPRSLFFQEFTPDN